MMICALRYVCLDRRFAFNLSGNDSFACDVDGEIMLINGLALRRAVVDIYGRQTVIVL